MLRGQGVRGQGVVEDDRIADRAMQAIQWLDLGIIFIANRDELDIRKRLFPERPGEIFMRLGSPLGLRFRDSAGAERVQLDIQRHHSDCRSGWQLDKSLGPTCFTERVLRGNKAEKHQTYRKSKHRNHFHFNRS
jgi:hypothetical protein